MSELLSQLITPEIQMAFTVVVVLLVILYILSIVCGFSVMFDSILSVGLLTDAIPYLGNAAVIREIISGEQRMHDVLISVGSNMAISVILVWLTSKAFSEEKHMVSF